MKSFYFRIRFMLFLQQLFTIDIKQTRYTMKKVSLNNLLVIGLVLFLSACASPETEGTMMAKKINECKSAYLRKAQNAASRFISGFEKGGYQTRTEAKQAYSDFMDEIRAEYQETLASLYEQKVEIENRYAKNYKQKAKYDDAFHSNLNYDLDEQVGNTVPTAAEIPESVMVKVRTIIPPKPDYQQIQFDLVGRSLKEGVEDGYYAKDWTWLIKDNQISDFNIESILADSHQEYCFIANMRLTSEVGKAFDTKVQIRYILPLNDDWTMEYIQSKGMHIVKTNKYNEKIRPYLDDYSGLFIENTIDMALEVGGKKLKSDEWEKFSIVIGPYKEECCDYNVTDFRIDYVELP